MFRCRLLVFFIAFSPAWCLGEELVKYQLPTWKSKHIHDEKKAETIVKTLVKLGCEVKKNQHSGHVDVSYRCPKWRQLRLDSHAEAHQWEKWLKEFRFQTVHKH